MDGNIDESGDEVREQGPLAMLDRLRDRAGIGRPRSGGGNAARTEGCAGEGGKGVGLTGSPADRASDLEPTLGVRLIDGGSFIRLACAVEHGQIQTAARQRRRQPLRIVELLEARRRPAKGVTGPAKVAAEVMGHRDEIECVRDAPGITDAAIAGQRVLVHRPTLRESEAVREDVPEPVQ